MLTKCMFCDGVIPAKYDNIYIKHMNDHHRAFVNIKLLFCVSLLDNHEVNGFIEDSGINFEAHIEEIVQKSSKDNEGVEEWTVDNDKKLAENVLHHIDKNAKLDKGYAKLNVKEIIEKMDNNLDITVVKVDEASVIVDNKEEKDKKISDHVIEAEEFKGEEAKTNEENIKPDIKVIPIRRKKRRPVVNCNCDIKFETKADEYRHIRVVHKKYFKCSKCKKGVFRREADYFTHISLKHNSKKNKSNICDECGHVALNSGKLKDHINYFHDSRAFQCEVCSLEITGKANFRRHGRKHEKPVDCKECGKTIRKSKIGLHMKTVHVIDKLKPYQCNVCGKGFPTKDRYNDHAAIHSETREFACRYGCSFASKTAGNRTKHEIQKHKAKFEAKKEIKAEDE